MFDVTFHPIREEEMEKHIFSFLEGKRSLEECAKNVAPNLDEVDHLKKVYESLKIKWEKITEDESTNFFTWHCGIIASYLHPFWWGKNVAFKNLPEFEKNYKNLILDICENDISLSSTIPKKFYNKTLQDSYGGGGYIPAKNISMFKEILIKNLKTEMVEECLWVELFFALEYAEQNNCGLLEVSGLYDTMQGSAAYDSNLRTLIIQGVCWPYVYISVPDSKDWKKKAMDFYQADPGVYMGFLKKYLEKQ